MSYYRITDSYTRFMTHCFWQNGFSNDELDSIIKVGESKIPQPATVDDNKVIESIRRSNTSWLSLQDIPWLYDRLAWIAAKLNGQYYSFDLEGFNEDLQYTVYDSAVKGNYDWHCDAGSDMNVVRKLSMVLFLTDPAEYEGGELQLQIGGGEPITMDKTKGMLHCFPSYMLHRVTPTTKGIRKSLVVWLTGPSFR